MAQPPPPTELVHLPGPSWLPAILALGIAMAVAGVFTWFPYLVAGTLIGLGALIAWLRRVRTDIARLPRRQRSAPAHIPLLPPRGRE